MCNHIDVFRVEGYRFLHGVLSRLYSETKDIISIVFCTLCSHVVACRGRDIVQSSWKSRDLFQAIANARGILGGVT